LKLKYDIQLSTSAFKFSLRRYNQAAFQLVLACSCVLAFLLNYAIFLNTSRGLHASTSQLNLSRFGSLNL